MSEVYFAPTKKAAPITPAQLKGRFVAAGLPCTIQEESPESHWMLFDPLDSNIYASTADDQITFMTFNYYDDDPKFLEKIERVMESIGFSADEDAEYI